MNSSYGTLPSWFHVEIHKIWKQRDIYSDHKNKLMHWNLEKHIRKCSKCDWISRLVAMLRGIQEIQSKTQCTNDISNHIKRNQKTINYGDSFFFAYAMWNNFILFLKCMWIHLYIEWLYNWPCPIFNLLSFPLLINF